MSDVGIPEAYHQAIEHPLQAGWMRAMMDPITAEQQLQITNTFNNTVVGAAAVINAVDNSSARREITRHTHELSGIGRLLLDSDEREIHKSMSASTEQIGDLIDWFSSAAGAAFARTSADNFTKIGLDLGGKRWAGKVSGTKPLEDMIGDIPRQLAEVNPTLKVIQPDAVRERTTRYNVLPGWWKIIESNQLDFLVMQQRRGVMDIVPPANTERRPSVVEVFEQRTDLIIVSQLPKHFQGEFQKMHKTPSRREASAKTDSRAAELAAKIQGKLLANPHGVTTAVVPIGTHYVMISRRQQR